MQLPSGRVVTLRRARELRDRPLDAVSPLFAGARALFASGDVVIHDGGDAVDVDALALGDFHALRAIATRAGWLSEETVTFSCRNCGESITHAPCAALPLGPFRERALTDPELDARFDFDAAHAAGTSDVRLAPLTLADAAPLHATLPRTGSRPLRIGPRLVTAMGIRELDGERSPEAIARALRRADHSTWDGVTNLFLAAHYTLRLFSMAQCAACRARNDVDAPYDREFEPSDEREDGLAAGASNGDPFVSFDAFDERARALAAEILPLAATQGPRPEQVTGLDGDASELSFVVEGGVAACDDGGEPLLGSYVPPFAGDARAPARSGEITVFYWTFRAIWDEEGPYDWEAELRETIEHELEHHDAHLADPGGDDPLDEEERRAIDEEAARIHGKRALVAAEAGALAGDVAEFFKRTWPIWAIVAVGTIVANLASC